MVETNQLRAWRGEFGNAYTDRCVPNWEARRPAFDKMIGGLDLTKILEVGCNRGHNLQLLADMFSNAEVVGIEPNPYAVRITRESSSKIAALHGDAFDIPFKDNYFDLVFTAGVLIHIALTDLPAALAEIHRASGRYILAVEYFAEKETTINYRGHDDLLWKRDFCKHYIEQHPQLDLVRSGKWEAGTAGMDECNWWLFEKNSPLNIGK